MYRSKGLATRRKAWCCDLHGPLPSFRVTSSYLLHRSSILDLGIPTVHVVVYVAARDLDLKKSVVYMHARRRSTT